MKKKSLFTLLLIPLFLFGCNEQVDSSVTSISSESSSTSFSSESSSTSSSSIIVSSSESSSSSSSSSNSSTIAVKSVSLNKTSLELTLEDSAYTLSATVLPKDASNKEVKWTSSNSKVATVSDGKVTPVGVGSTNIKVTTVDGNKTFTCKVTVKKKFEVLSSVIHGLFTGDNYWSDIDMDQNESVPTEYYLKDIPLYSNEVIKIHMTTTEGDEWYGYSALKSSSSIKSVTQTSTDDNIKILTSGVYDIYCDHNESDGGHLYLKKTKDITPTGVESVSLNRTGIYLVVRHDFFLIPTIYPEDAENQEVLFRSSNDSIATVTSGGRVVGVSVSEKPVTITATTLDGYKTATCEVYVASNEIPDYYLTGKINSRNYTYGQYNFAAIKDNNGKYWFPDVTVKKGDEITITQKNGATIKNKSGKSYTYSVSQDGVISFNLHPNDTNYNFLTIKN